MNAYSEENISISAVGDIMMGTTWPEPVLPPRDGAGIFDAVKEDLRADLVFGNLEGPLIDKGKGKKCKEHALNCYEFRTPTRYVKYLKEAGFNALNIANNHANDFGIKGVESTISTLEGREIQPVGGEKIASFVIKGKKIAIAGFSFTQPPTKYSCSILDIPKAAELVAGLKKDNDIVIVSFHGGAEGRNALHITPGPEIFCEEERGDVVAFAHTLVDSGADLILGHGPHVPRAFEIYKGKLIVYSMGNFLTYGMFNIKEASGAGMIVKAELDPATSDFVRGRIVSLRLQNKGIPFPDPENGTANIVKELSAADLDPAGIKIADNGALEPISAIAGKSPSSE